MNKLVITGYDWNTKEDNFMVRHHRFHYWLSGQTDGDQTDRITTSDPRNYFGHRDTSSVYYANWERSVNRYLTVTNREYAIDDVPSINRMTGGYTNVGNTSSHVRRFLLWATNIWVTAGDGWEIVTCSSWMGDGRTEYDHVFLIEDDTLALQFKLAKM
jgi:hypothetical protein